MKLGPVDPSIELHKMARQQAHLSLKQWGHMNGQANNLFPMMEMLAEGGIDLGKLLFDRLVEQEVDPLVANAVRGGLEDDTQ